LVTDLEGKGLGKNDGISALDDLDFSPLKVHLKKLSSGNSNLACKIIFEAKDYLIIDKPAGIHCHPISLLEDNTVTHWALYHFPETGKNFDKIQPEITPHRLDRDTSGLLIVCKTRSSFEEWRKKFHAKSVTKTYLAWVWGDCKGGLIENHLTKTSDRGNKMKVVQGGGKTLYKQYFASSLVSLVKKEERYPASLVKIICRTGVTHQVRVHLASIGYPLVGDELYDNNFVDRPLSVKGHRLRAIILEWEKNRIALEEDYPIN
jgi:23S rRNA pseudouridine1911/1915/1917 synthase